MAASRLFEAVGVTELQLQRLAIAMTVSSIEWEGAEGELLMARTAEDRRRSLRFEVHLALRYRQSEKGIEHRWSTGITRDMSRDGVAFKTRQPLPVGSHVELRIDWPVKQESVRPIDLQATGFVVWSDHRETAVRISSHKFRVHMPGGIVAQDLV